MRRKPIATVADFDVADALMPAELAPRRVFQGHIFLAGPDKGRGVLTDSFGWPVNLTCVAGEVEGVRALIVAGELGDVPDHMCIELIDGRKPEVSDENTP